MSQYDRPWVARATTSPFNDILGRQGPMVDLLVGQYYHWQGRERFDAILAIDPDGVTLHTEEMDEGIRPQSGPIRIPLALAEVLHQALNDFFQQPAPPSVDALQEALTVERARVDKVMENLLTIVNQEMP